MEKIFFPQVSFKLIKIENYNNRKVFYYDLDGNEIIEEKIMNINEFKHCRISDFTLETKSNCLSKIIFIMLHIYL